VYVSAGQLLKTATVALTHVTTTDTATVKPSAASVPSQVTVASVPSQVTVASVPSQVTVASIPSQVTVASVPSQVTVASASSCSVAAQQSALPSQSVTKQKPAEPASSALNKTFEKDPHGSDS